MVTEEATEEAKGIASYVYVQTIGHLWRFDLEGEDSNFDESAVRHGPGDVKKGVLTKLIDFQREGLPLATVSFAWDSKLYFVGGETVKPRSPPPPPHIHDKEDIYINQYCDISLNKRVFVFDNSEPMHPSLIRSGFESESLAPKSRPFVIPIKNEDKTLFYVISTTPVLYNPIARDPPIFEVYDPVLNLWKALDSPPYPQKSFLKGRNNGLRIDIAFQLDRKIFIWMHTWELVFDLDTNKWERSHLFYAWSAHLAGLVPVSDGVLLGCWSFMLRAYKLCSKPEHGTLGGLVRHQRLQGLSELCGPYWPVNSVPSSTLCNLGDGYMLFVSTSLCPKRKNLHFFFVTFRVRIFSPNDKKRPRKEHFFNGPMNFVDAVPVAYCHRVVPCEDGSWMNWKVLQAYVL